MEPAYRLLHEGPFPRPGAWSRAGVVSHAANRRRLDSALPMAATTVGQVGELGAGVPFRLG